MLEHRGNNNSSMITGSSVHNCRVERTHRDVYAGVLSFFAKSFHELEESNLLDPLDERHLLALHHTFIPRINASLNEFRKQWNHHGLSTEHGLSPIQLYTSGILENANSDNKAINSIFTSEPELFGIDPDGPIPISDEDYQVTVPDVEIELTAAQSEALATYCYPLEDDNNSGKNVYFRCLSMLNVMS